MKTTTPNQYKKQLEPLLKPVEKVDLVDLIPGIQTNPQQECAIIIQDGDEKKIVNVCSKQYHLLPNKHFIEPLLEVFGDSKIQIVTDARLDARFSIDIIFEDLKADIMGKDPVKAKLKVHNSYDGRAKYQFHMGFFRMICKNGMVIPLEGFENKNISSKMRHMPILGDTFDKDSIRSMVDNFGMNMLDYQLPFTKLAEMRVSEAQLPDLLKEVTGKTKFPVRQLDDVIDRLQIEMNELDEDLNHWLIYNAFNYQLNHSEAIVMDPSKKEQLDHDIFALLLK